MIRKLQNSFFLILLALISCGVANTEAKNNTNPKREFRGAWLHVIGQDQWLNKTPEQHRAYIVDQFDKLEKAGCNAIIFQVRPTADALYVSDYEPWSRFLTGKRGLAPSPLWDPMEFAIQEAHKRGMEFHAWLNPYRVTSGPNDSPAANKDYSQNPSRYIKYDGKIFFDPAYQENRDFICKIVDDIVTRYDVDAIHIDDYFYPYPDKNKSPINDDASYKKFGKGMNRADWRRQNVNLLIEQMYNTIKSNKPWVRFGVSPFGIWRNKKNDPRGSNSNGFQNYDGLYADVLLWDEKGWVDYVVPQLYWALKHNLAPTGHLAEWWNNNIHNADLYIGYDTRQTMNTADSNGQSSELDSKVKLARKLNNVKGHVWWHGYWVTENLKGVRDKLQSNYQSTLALPPVYGDPKKKPEPVKNLKVNDKGGKVSLSWEAGHGGKRAAETDIVKFVVYQFEPGENSDDLENAEAIISITPYFSLTLADFKDKKDLKGHTFVVTSVDRMNRESKPTKIAL